ncbi:MAG: hypothetical protein ACOCUI_00650 [bacterium]
MGFNLKKAKIDYKQEEGLLEDRRKNLNQEPMNDGFYERNFSKERKKHKEEIWEKSLSKKHTEGKDSPSITEAKFEKSKKHDDRTHKTNTLPINELAEESQRKRLEARGESGIDEKHFQNYKKKDLKLTKENFSKLENINKQIDELWMASSWNRLTTSEKKKIKNLISSRDKIIRV